MDSFQQDCVDHDPQLSDFLVPVRKAHITLLVLHVSQEKMEEANDIFNAVIQEKVVGYFDGDDIFEVTFEGAGIFNKRVVFAEPKNNTERMVHMNREFYKAFSEKGFTCEPNFSPHLTLLKKGFKRGNDLQEVPKEAFENSMTNILEFKNFLEFSCYP